MFPNNVKSALAVVAVVIVIAALFIGWRVSVTRSDCTPQLLHTEPLVEASEKSEVERELRLIIPNSAYVDGLGGRVLVLVDSKFLSDFYVYHSEKVARALRTVWTRVYLRYHASSARDPIVKIEIVSPGAVQRFDISDYRCSNP